MRDRAEGITRFKPLQTFLYWLQFLIVTSVLLFPLTVYEGFFREHQYGLATQNFGGWLGDLLKGLGVGVVLGGTLMMVLYGVLRRTPRTWWISRARSTFGGRRGCRRPRWPDCQRSKGESAPC